MVSYQVENSDDLSPNFVLHLSMSSSSRLKYTYHFINLYKAGPFEKPPSRGGSGQDVVTPLPLKDHMTQQKDVDMLIDEELALWPESG